MPRFIFPVLITLMLIPSISAAATTAQAVHEMAARAAETEAAATVKYQQWVDRKEQIAADILDMKAKDSWLEFKNRKYASYVKKQEEVIAELQRREEEAKRIEMELEPFLETIVERLEQFISTDLPFLTEERRNRVQFLRSSLNDYRLELSEKLRRVFEALLVETEYGRTVASPSQTLDINGTPTQVSVFRLGRTALFYQTADGSAAGTWDKSSGKWIHLEEQQARTLRKARDMADRKRSVELLVLPIGESK